MSKSALLKALVGIAAVALVLPAAATAKPKPKVIEQVGHEPLMSRGMNAAAAIHGDYAYIGSRTDGGHEGMPHGGIMVVDISDPSAPKLLHRRSPARREAGRVLARAARVAVPGHPDRPEHELRRRRIAASLHPAVDQQLPLLRHLRSERGEPAAPPPVRRRHPRVLPVGGPEQPQPRPAVRRQRQFHVRDKGWLSQLPVLGVGHLAGARRAGAGHVVQRTAPLQAVPSRAGTRPDSDGRSALAVRQQRRDEGVLRAADRRLRGRRHVRLRGGSAGRRSPTESRRT